MHKFPVDRQQRALPITLFILALLCAILHIAVTLLSHTSVDGVLAKAIPLFDLDNEQNVPSAYTGMLLGASSLAAFMAGSYEKIWRYKFTWFGLAGLFLYLGFDELLSIHERFAEPIRKILTISEGSFLYHAWVIPVVALGAILGTILLIIKNRIDLISAKQRKILLTLFVLIIGNVALESLGTQFYYSNLVYKLVPVFIEEMFEIGMISYILYQFSRSLPVK